MKTHYGRQWDDPANYHLVFNSDRMTFGEIADVVAGVVRMRNWQRSQTGVPV